MGSNCATDYLLANIYATVCSRGFFQFSHRDKEQPVGNDKTFSWMCLIDRSSLQLIFFPALGERVSGSEIQRDSSGRTGWFSQGITSVVCNYQLAENTLKIMFSFEETLD